MNKKKHYFTLDTMKNKICNKTECDYNDFGRCLTEPIIEELTIWNENHICRNYSYRQMKMAEEELK